MSEIPRALPAGTTIVGRDTDLATAVLSPVRLASLPPDILEGVRQALSLSLHVVFLSGLPIIAVALVASLLIREVSLPRKVPASTAATSSSARPEVERVA